MSTKLRLDEPNTIRASKCPVCNGNVLVCGVKDLTGKSINRFTTYEAKFGCKTTHITLRQARDQKMCFKPNACG